MPRCIIIGCNTNLKTTKQHEKDVSYHIFPKDPQRRNIWMNSIKLPPKFDADKSFVCSKHFISDDFEHNSLNEQFLDIKITKRLKKTGEYYYLYIYIFIMSISNTIKSITYISNS